MWQIQKYLFTSQIAELCIPKKRINMQIQGSNHLNFKLHHCIATVRQEKDPKVTLSSNLLGFWNACFLAHLWNKWETTDLSSTENLYKGERNQLNYIWERERKREKGTQMKGKWNVGPHNKKQTCGILLPFPYFSPSPKQNFKGYFLCY